MPKAAWQAKKKTIFLENIAILLLLTMILSRARNRLSRGLGVWFERNKKMKKFFPILLCVVAIAIIAITTMHFYFKYQTVYMSYDGETYAGQKIA